MSHFNYPTEVCASSGGSTLYVSDRNSHCIVVLRAADGDRLRQYGSGVAGSGPDQFNKPCSLALHDDDRTLFVCDTGNCRMLMLDDTTGEVQCELSVCAVNCID